MGNERKKLEKELAKDDWALEGFRPPGETDEGEADDAGLFTAVKVTANGIPARQVGETPEQLLERVRSWERDNSDA